MKKLLLAVALVLGGVAMSTKRAEACTYREQQRVIYVWHHIGFIWWESPEVVYQWVCE